MPLKQIVLLYLYIQKYLISGLTQGGGEGLGCEVPGDEGPGGEGARAQCLLKTS